MPPGRLHDVCRLLQQNTLVVVDKLERICEEGAKDVDPTRTRAWAAQEPDSSGRTSLGSTLAHLYRFVGVVSPHHSVMIARCQPGGLVLTTCCLQEYAGV